MGDLIAAVPWEVWVAGLLAAAIGGLAAALARCDDDGQGDEEPEDYPHEGADAASEADEPDGLGWDPIWDEYPRPGRAARGRKEAP